MTYRYFENELRYLYEAGRVFAEAYPDRARFLNIDSIEDRDPYVERLFEGFAFLTGRIQERLDDDLPEITQRLIGLLYPHFLKPFPSCAIVELAPREGLVQEPTRLDRGTQVLSEPVGKDRCAVTFATVHDVMLNPLTVERAEVNYFPDDTSSLKLRLKLHRGADLSALEIDPLRLFIHADGPTASTMHLFMTRHVTRVRVSTGGAEQPFRTLRGQHAVLPGGINSDESILPAEPATFSGIRLLQEYLLYRRRFWFVDIVGIGEVPDDPGDSLEVEVFFDRPYPENHRVKAENIRLHCSPVVNLFDHDAEPIRVDHKEDEVRIQASNRHPFGIATYDVREVVGTEEASGKRYAYSPYYSLAVAPPASDGGRTYVDQRRIGVTGRPEVYLSLNSPQLSSGDPPPEILSVSLRCTNGSLPNEALQEGGLTKLHPSARQVADPENLDQPTLVRYPPLSEHRDMLWSLLAHWTFNHQSVASHEAVAGLLEMYDWSGSEANRRRRKGIRSVTWAGKEHVVRGAIRRGAEVTIEVEDDAFQSDGDLCLFGLVMSQFFSQYATINAFVHLTLRTAPSGRSYSWTPDRGSRPPV